MVEEFLQKLPEDRRDLFCSTLHELGSSLSPDRAQSLTVRLQEVKVEIRLAFDRLHPLKGRIEGLTLALDDLDSFEAALSNELILLRQVLRSYRELLKQKVDEGRPDALLAEKEQITRELSLIETTQQFGRFNSKVLTHG